MLYYIKKKKEKIYLKRKGNFPLKALQNTIVNCLGDNKKKEQENINTEENTFVKKLFSV